MKKTSKFLVFTDLHHGNIMPDAKERFEKIIQEARQQEVDFIINLGDFCWAMKENLEMIEKWNHLEIPHYLVAGNHDFDSNDEEAFKQFFCLENTYYAFEDESFHYMVLDTNYYKHENQEYHYAHGNYYGYEREFVSQEQLRWLEEEVHRTDKLCVIFSHAQLNYSRENGQGGCGNHKELHELLNRLNQEAGFQKVCVAINGHNHTDSYSCWDGIHHLDINSASNQWLGEDCAYLDPEETYSEEMHKECPYLKYVIPYTEPLFAVIEMNKEENYLKLKGRETTFVGPSPKARGHQGMMGVLPITAKISNLNLELMKK